MPVSVKCDSHAKKIRVNLEIQHIPSVIARVKRGNSRTTAQRTKNGPTIDRYRQWVLDDASDRLTYDLHIADADKSDA